MKRIATLAVLLASLVLMLTAAPASAHWRPPTPPKGFPPMCITTQWRSHYLHKPMTRPGEWCTYLETDGWLPKSWWLQAVATDRQGRNWDIVQRPRR